MAKELVIFLVVISILDIFGMDIDTGKELIYGLTVRNMKVIGLTVYKQVKELIYGLTVPNIKVIL